MKMNTDDLIERMGRELRPVEPLPSPWTRTGVWAGCAALYLGVIVASMVAIGGDGGAATTAFWVSQALAVTAGGLAVAAAFASVVPGLASRAGALALAAAAVWLVTLVAMPSANADWSAIGAARHEWWCVGFIVVGGAPLAASLIYLLRRGAPLSPVTTALFAALAVGLLANVGACVTLPHTNGAVTLVWHGGVVMALAAIGALTGHFAFSWRNAKR